MMQVDLQNLLWYSNLDPSTRGAETIFTSVVAIESVVDQSRRS